MNTGNTVKNHTDLCLAGYRTNTQLPYHCLYSHKFFMKKIQYLIILASILSLLSACAVKPAHQVPDKVKPIVADREFSENELLNISITVFDPGEIPSDHNEQQGLSPQIRKAESRFIPVHLKYTLQRTGYFGAVRVVPDDDPGSEIIISGKIELSDGESTVLNITAKDARGIIWFQKDYAETAKPYEHLSTEPEKEDTFQDLFNTVANDLILARNNLQEKEVHEIKNIAELRYATDMAPNVFSSYLREEQNGRFFIDRLPAHQDPMLQRVRNIQPRDDMLIDAINNYYDAYYRDLWDPYQNWRKYRSQEVEAMRQLEREALTEQVLGIAAIVGAIALGASSDSATRAQTTTLREVMIMGGAAAIYSGTQKKQESAINQEAIEELGDSFASEAKPLIIEVDGETVRLSGSAEQQYSKWRQLLKKIYASETGLVNDFQAPVEPDIDPKNDVVQ